MSKLDLSKEKFALLLDIIKQINSNLELNELLTLIMDNVKSFLQTDASSLLLLDHFTNELYFNRATGDFDAIQQIRVPVGIGIAGIVAKSGKPLIVNDSNDSRIYREVDKKSSMTTRNLIAVPLEIKGKSIGVLEVLNSQNGEDFSDDDLEMLIFFSQFAALAINNRALLDDAMFQVKQLDAIYHLAQIVGKQSSADNYLKSAINIISENISCERISIIHREKGSKNFQFLSGKNISKSVLKTGPVTIKDNILAYILKTKEGIFCYDIEKDSRFGRNKDLRYKSVAFISVPFFNSAGVVCGFISVTELHADAIQSQNLKFLTRMAQDFYYGYNNILLKKAAREKEILDAEITVAAKMQDSLLPETLPQLKDYDIAAASIPCKQVGGDFYDVLLDKNSELKCLISDISGKGFPSTVFMSACRSIIRMIATKENSLKTIITEANRGIFESSKSGMFATAFMVKLNSKTKKINYVNAGHFEQLLYKNSNKNVIELHSKSKPLGVLNDSNYIEKSIKYAKNDILILFTDGIIEAVNKSNVYFGLEKLKKTIIKNAKLSAQELKESIIKDVRKFQKGKEFSDDLSLLIIKFN